MSTEGIKVNFYNEKVISLSFLDKSDPVVPGVVNFSNLFLRDASTSSDTLSLENDEKLISTGEIDRAIQAKEEPKVFQKNSEYVVEVHWSDGNVSEYTESFLRKYSCSDKRRAGKYYEESADNWDLTKIEKNKKHLYVDYEAYLNDDRALLQVLECLNRFGIAFIKNVPPQNGENWFIESIANRIGYIKDTFYGRTFDVTTGAGAKHAYTDLQAGLHMDLLYYESPPGLQLLHSIKNNVDGGEIYFADSFNAAKYLLEKDPPAYTACGLLPINFQYTHGGLDYFYSRPLIVEDLGNIDPRTDYPFIKEVNYSPPFQAPFENGITSPLKRIGEFENLSQMDINYRHSAKSSGERYYFRDFHRGLKIFEEFINSKENQLKLKLEEGTCVIFDNRRILHGREPFDRAKASERWIKGCYVDRDAYYSKLRTIYKKFNVDGL